MTALLTIHPADSQGDSRWELDAGATLYDVTHLACRSARYTPSLDGSCSPANAQQSAFPVAPGGTMPSVEGCTKQDYAVLIVIGVDVEDRTAVALQQLALSTSIKTSCLLIFHFSFPFLRIVVSFDQ